MGLSAIFTWNNDVIEQLTELTDRVYKIKPSNCFLEENSNTREQVSGLDSGLLVPPGLDSELLERSGLDSALLGPSGLHSQLLERSELN